MEPLDRRFPVYNRLLRLYPYTYRKVYGQQMLQTLADMLDGTAPSQHPAIWARTTIDLLTTLPAQQVEYIGGIMINQMPTYIKRNSLMGAMLLIPFAAALAANTLSQMFRHQTLYSSWVWHSPFIGLWVLWLPLIAFVLALGSLIVFGIRERHRGAVRQISTYWPLVIVLLAGTGILATAFGHDSAHCLLGNPVSEARNIHATWQCIQNGASTYPFQHPLEFLKRAFAI